jgi:predicted DNA-binding transcriptional regulator YafY
MEARGMSIAKYVGRTVVIVYMDKKERISKRTIRVIRVDAGTIYAFDMSRNAPRRFASERILAVQPVIVHAS